MPFEHCRGPGAIIKEWGDDVPPWSPNVMAMGGANTSLLLL